MALQIMAMLLGRSITETTGAREMDRIAQHYVDHLFRKNQGKHKAIIVKEYTLSERPVSKVTAVLAETGESLPVDECMFAD